MINVYWKKNNCINWNFNWKWAEFFNWIYYNSIVVEIIKILIDISIFDFQPKIFPNVRF